MPTRIDASWYERDPGAATAVAAGGIVMRAVQGRPYIALVQEAAGTAFILPKGRLEAGESPEEAAIREIGEEAGLTDLTLVAPLGLRERYDFRKTHWKITHYFLFTTRQAEGQPTDPNHAYVLQWFPMDALPAMFWPEQGALIEAHQVLLEDLARA